MTKNLTLPSGKNAVLHEGRGFDLLQAQRKAKTSEEIPYALIAELTEIDGQKLVYEDVLELPIEDVIALQSAISGKFQDAKATEIPQTAELKPTELPNAKLEETVATLNSLTRNQ